MKRVWSMRTQFYLPYTSFMKIWYDEFLKAVLLIFLKHLVKNLRVFFIHRIHWTHSHFSIIKILSFITSEIFKTTEYKTVSILVCLLKEQLTANKSVYSLSTINLKTFHLGNLYKLHSLETYYHQTKIH